MTRKVLFFALVLSYCLVADAGQLSTPSIEAPNLTSFLASLDPNQPSVAKPQTPIAK
jgi:hypothetical protein